MRRLMFLMSLAIVLLLTGCFSSKRTSTVTPVVQEELSSVFTAAKPIRCINEVNSNLLEIDGEIVTFNLRVVKGFDLEIPGYAGVSVRQETIDELGIEEVVRERVKYELNNFCVDQGGGVSGWCLIEDDKLEQFFKNLDYYLEQATRYVLAEFELAGKSFEGIHEKCDGLYAVYYDLEPPYVSPEEVDQAWYFGEYRFQDAVLRGTYEYYYVGNRINFVLSEKYGDEEFGSDLQFQSLAFLRGNKLIVIPYSARQLLELSDGAHALNAKVVTFNK